MPLPKVASQPTAAGRVQANDVPQKLRIAAAIPGLGGAPAGAAKAAPKPRGVTATPAFSLGGVGRGAGCGAGISAHLVLNGCVFVIS